VAENERPRGRPDAPRNQSRHTGWKLKEYMPWRPLRTLDRPEVLSVSRETKDDILMESVCRVGQKRHKKNQRKRSSVESKEIENGGFPRTGKEGHNTSAGWAQERVWTDSPWVTPPPEPGWGGTAAKPIFLFPGVFEFAGRSSLKFPDNPEPRRSQGRKKKKKKSETHGRASSFLSIFGVKEGPPSAPPSKKEKRPNVMY